MDGGRFCRCNFSKLLYFVYKLVVLLACLFGLYALYFLCVSGSTGSFFWIWSRGRWMDQCSKMRATAFSSVRGHWMCCGASWGPHSLLSGAVILNFFLTYHLSDHVTIWEFLCSWDFVFVIKVLVLLRIVHLIPYV